MTLSITRSVGESVVIVIPPSDEVQVVRATIDEVRGKKARIDLEASGSDSEAVFLRNELAADETAARSFLPAEVYRDVRARGLLS